MLAAGNTGSYTSGIACNRPGLTPDADGRGGTFQVPAVPEAVTCTITNTRTFAQLVLQKTWVNGAAGDTADLTITGPDAPTFGSATSTATGAAGPVTDTANRATAPVFSGGTVDLAEVLGAANTGSYTSGIACDQPGLTPDPDGQGGSFEVPDAPVAVTCTISNGRTSARLMLQKTWMNGAAGDTALLSISGSAPAMSAGHVHRNRRRRVGNRLRPTRSPRRSSPGRR